MSRVAKNRVTEEVLVKEQAGAALEELLPLITGERSVKVYYEGDVDAGIWSCGQVVGLIHDIPTVRELIERMVTEAVQILRRLNGLRVTPGA